MKGDKGNFNKFEEMFYRVSLGKEFNEDIKAIRKSMGIPEGGFFSEDQRRDWMREEKSRALNMYGVEFNVLKKYELPPTCQSLLSNYIDFNGEKPINKMQKPDVAVIDKYPKGTWEDFYKEMEQPFVKIYIFDDSNVKHVQKFIKDNWDTIKGMLMDQRPYLIPEMRSTRNKERDKTIFELYSKSREELGLKKGEDKDVKVASLLKEKYPRLTADNVRKIVAEQKKLRE